MFKLTSARDFALNVRRHLVISVVRRQDGGGFLLTKDMRENKKINNRKFEWNLTEI